MSTGTLIIKRGEKWHNVRIAFRAQQAYVEPILHDWWSSQEGANRILETCGRGIKMVFVRVPKEEIPEGTAFAGWINEEHSMNAWHNGEQFDHSPNDCLSPIKEDMSKMVLEQYNSGPSRVTISFDSLEQAKQNTNQPFLYIWDGESWTYEKNLPKTRKERRGTAWSRRR